MGAYIDIQKNEFLREVWAKGIAEGEAKGVLAILSAQLEDKFGPLPRWAFPRLRKASPEQTLEWSRKVLKAAKLEGVVGPR